MIQTCNNCKVSFNDDAQNSTRLCIETRALVEQEDGTEALEWWRSIVWACPKCSVSVEGAASLVEWSECGDAAQQTFRLSQLHPMSAGFRLPRLKNG
jgi:hypothetical protein